MEILAYSHPRWAAPERPNGTEKFPGERVGKNQDREVEISGADDSGLLEQRRK